jgi:hypothetical protein
MKYLKFTYVDAKTGISVAVEPAMHGTTFPVVAGLAFVWARESAYPTPVPLFYGTCPADSSTDVAGVLQVLAAEDYTNMWADEVRAKVPSSISMAKARAVLIKGGHMPAITASLAAMEGVEGEVARSDWEFAQTVDRHDPLTQFLATALGLTDLQVDALFIAAA